LSNELLQSLGDSDPCDDFYLCISPSSIILNGDTCGGFAQKNVLQPGESQHTVIGDVESKITVVLGQIVNGSYPESTPPFGDTDIQNFQKLQDAYLACLNETQLDYLGAGPLLAILQDLISRYPTDNTSSHVDLTPAFVYLQGMRVAALMELYVGVCLFL